MTAPECQGPELYSAIALGALLFVSEYLSTNKHIETNGIIDALIKTFGVIRGSNKTDQDKVADDIELQY